jgi:anti-sigma B factor antagonist
MPGTVMDGRRFECRTEHVGDDAAIVDVSGEIDIATAPRLKEQLSGAVDEGHTSIVVDLNDVTFVDSITLGILVGARNSLGGRGRLTLACANPRVLMLLELTGLDAAFETFPTPEDALAHARG